MAATAVLEIVAARHVVPIGDVREVRERTLVSARRLVLRRRQLLAQLHDVAEAGEERREHVSLGLDLVRLAVVADGHVALDHHRAAVRVDLLAEQPEERRLAGAVRRHERRALTDGERERDVVEERIARVTEFQIGDLEDRHLGPRYSREIAASDRRSSSLRWACTPTWAAHRADR